MKKLVFVLMLAALTFPAYGSGGSYIPPNATDIHIIGDWEDDSGDGWVDWNWGQGQIGTLPNERYERSTIGVTHGNYSLKKTYPEGWGQYLSLHNYECAYSFTPADFLSHSLLQIDITYDSGSWPSDTTYAAMYCLSIQTGSYGWQDVGGGDTHSSGGVVFSDTLNPSNPGYLPLVNVGTPGTTMTGTWTWDYSAILPGGSYTGSKVSADDTWVNFIFAFNTDAVGSYYIDYARLVAVPEPATMALLCLGAFALLRKKR